MAPDSFQSNSEMMSIVADRASLRADCARCFALCCVGPAFLASADFAISKPAGQPCPNLRADFRCAIHDRLRPAGFPGCATYDCFGAGQQVCQVTFGGRDWRDAPETAGQMFAVFAVMRQLHELLWYLSEALEWPAGRPLHAELRAERAEIRRLTRLGPTEVSKIDAAARRQAAADLLRRVSNLVRTEGAGQEGADLAGADLAGADLAGADLAGRDLRGTDLRRSSLRSATLIGADLRGADLRLADVLGADFRGVSLGGADLSRALFLTQSQLEAATGNRRTLLPAALARPAHWAHR